MSVLCTLGKIMYLRKPIGWSSNLSCSICTNLWDIAGTVLEAEVSMSSYLSWHSEYHGRGGFSAILEGGQGLLRSKVCKKQVEFSCLTGRLREHTAHVFGVLSLAVSGMHNRRLRWWKKRDQQAVLKDLFNADEGPWPLPIGKCEQL